MKDKSYAGFTVYSRDGKKRGVTSGAYRYCPMEGCGGIKLLTLWQDGKRTWVCDKSLVKYRNGLRLA